MKQTVKKRRVSGPHGNPRAPAWIGVGLTLLSVLFFAASFPGGPFPWLAWIAFVPFFYALQQAGPLRGFLLGALFGWLVWVSSVWWLYLPLRDILGMSGVAAILLTLAGCLLNGLSYAVAGFLVSRWPAKGMFFGAGRNAAIFTLTTTLLVLVFPGNIAHSQYLYPAILQVLELGGVPLLLFLIYWTNWLLAYAVRDMIPLRSLRWKPMVSGAAIPLLILAYGLIRLHQFDVEAGAAGPEKRITIGAIQPNIPTAVPEKRQPAPEAAVNDFYTAMEQAKTLAEKNPAIDLLAFPENPGIFFFNEDGARRQALGNLITATGKPVVLNADGREAPAAHDGVPVRYNLTVFLNADRNLVNSYLKIRRLPIVEHLPGEESLPWLRNRFPRNLNVAAGPGPTVFEIRDDIRVIPSICYEATLSSFTRDFIRQGGNIIVNQVNDSWFQRTAASEIHLSLALCRTVEYRVPMVRVTNSGVGAHIEASGRIVPGSRTELFTEAATAFPLYVPPNRSLYARLGNSWMVVFAVFLIGSFRRRKTYSGKAR